MSTNIKAVYTVKELEAKDGGEAKKLWVRIGTCVPHKKGEGFNLYLDALPIDGKLVVMPIEKAEQEAA
jgi:hypothetical protein